MAPAEASAEDVANAESARRLSREQTDMALAFEAVEAIQFHPLRLATMSQLLWGAGDLFRALEVAGEGLAYAPRDPSLLLTATNLGLIVGASDAASLRLDRLKEVLAADEAMAENVRTWWNDQVEPLEGFRDEAAAVAEAKAGAIRASRAASWFMGALAVGLMLALSLARPSAARASASS